MSVRKRNIIISVSFIIIIAMLTGVLILNYDKDTALFTGLTQAEAKEILEVLDSSGISASYKNGTITVPSSQIDNIREQHILQGYPNVKLQ